MMGLLARRRDLGSREAKAELLSSGRQRREQRITRRKNMAQRRKKAADSRGGGEISSGDAGSKERSAGSAALAPGKQRWPRGRREGKMDPLKQHGLLQVFRSSAAGRV